jgi:UDP-2,4-diacetamido-2,4,6-trideoxy-beta-L-altropyranose hydrolase
MEVMISNDFQILKIDGIANGNSQEQDSEQLKIAIENSKLKPDWIVVDHYEIGIDWEKEVGSLCKHVLVIDDLADRIHQCDLLLDQGYFADPYRRYANNLNNFAVRLMGPKYCLLRSEFTKALRESPTPKVSRINVSYGGTDPTAETEKVLSLVDEFSGIEFDFVVGANNPRLNSIQARIESLPNAAASALGSGFAREFLRL